MKMMGKLLDDSQTN